MYLGWGSFGNRAALDAVINSPRSAYVMMINPVSEACADVVWCPDLWVEVEVRWRDF